MVGVAVKQNVGIACKRNASPIGRDHGRTHPIIAPAILVLVQVPALLRLAVHEVDIERPGLAHAAPGQHREIPRRKCEPAAIVRDRRAVCLRLLAVQRHRLRSQFVALPVVQPDAGAEDTRVCLPTRQSTEGEEAAIARDPRLVATGNHQAFRIERNLGCRDLLRCAAFEIKQKDIERSARVGRVEVPGPADERDPAAIGGNHRIVARPAPFEAGQSHTETSRLTGAALMEEDVGYLVLIASDEVVRLAHKDDPIAVTRNARSVRIAVCLEPAGADADALGRAREAVAHKNIAGAVRITGHQVGSVAIERDVSTIGRECGRGRVPAGLPSIGSQAHALRKNLRCGGRCRHRRGRRGGRCGRPGWRANSQQQSRCGQQTRAMPAQKFIHPHRSRTVHERKVRAGDPSGRGKRRVGAEERKRRPASAHQCAREALCRARSFLIRLRPWMGIAQAGRNREVAPAIARLR